MIARIWRASATADGASMYRDHFNSAVLPELQACAGFLGASLLQQGSDGQTEIMVISRWESLESIRSFAGDNINLAVVEPAARAVLTDAGTTVAYYTIVEEHN